jgi:hypothetical protein
MLKSFLLAITLVLASIYAVFAADPKAVIDAKATAVIGESVWLKTTNSIGKNFQWRILPQGEETCFTILPIFGGLDDKGAPIVSYWAHYSSMKAGTIYFVLVATEDNKSDVGLHTLIYGGGNPTPVPPDPVTPEIPTPSSDLVSIVSPITPILVGEKSQLKKDVSALKSFYLEMADTLTRDKDTKVIKTTDQLRQTNINAGTIAFQNTGMKSRYPGLGQAIDKALADKLGLDIVELTDLKRKDAIDIFTAIAWACQQADKK